MSLTPKKTNGASQMTRHIMKLMVKYETNDANSTNGTAT